MTKQFFTLRELAILHGSLVSITRFHAWGRAQFFLLQNAFRDAIIAGYHIAKRNITNKYLRSAKTTTEREAALNRGIKEFAAFEKQEIPNQSKYRLEFLAPDNIARALWNSRRRITITPEARNELRLLHTHLADSTNRWESRIGHIIPRRPHITGYNDASNEGGGLFNETLQFWTDIRWSAKVRQGRTRQPNHADYIQIDVLEYIMVILQVAGTIEVLRTSNREHLRRLFGHEIPAEPLLLDWCDNIVSVYWIKHGKSNTKRAQNLVRILAEILLSFDSLGLSSQYITSASNECADNISRPDLSLSPLDNRTQLFLKHLPKSLGQLVPASSIISNSFTI